MSVSISHIVSSGCIISNCCDDCNDELLCSNNDDEIDEEKSLFSYFSFH